MMWEIPPAIERRWQRRLQSGGAPGEPPRAAPRRNARWTNKTLTPIAASCRRR
jgi:hypothetical protein